MCSETAKAAISSSDSQYVGIEYSSSDTPVPAYCLGDPERDSDQQGQHQRAADQQDVLRQLLTEDRVHRLVLLERIAQVPVQHLPQEAPVLHRKRAVQPIGGD